MTPLQAADFREFLSNELTANGFSDIVDEVNFRLLERFNDDERPLQGQNEILFFFLGETIKVFDQISNKDFSTIVSRINENLEEGSIEGIEVELLGKGEAPFNLAELPDYRIIANILSEIYEQIYNDNDTINDDDNSGN